MSWENRLYLPLSLSQDPEISRTLTLISKTIQSLGSWGSLSKNKLVCQLFVIRCAEGNNFSKVSP